MNMAEGKWIIQGVRAVIGDVEVEDAAVVIANGKIAEILVGGERPQAGSSAVVDGGGGWLLPGFIDVHVHGGFGSDFMDASKEAYDAIASFHAAHGTTRMLATTVTAPPEAIAAVLEATAAYRRNPMPFASLEGVHLEGPFISELWPGAQNPNFISPPRLDWVQAWNEAYPDDQAADAGSGEGRRGRSHRVPRR